MGALLPVPSGSVGTLLAVHTRHSLPLKTYGPKFPRVSSVRAVIGPRHGCQPVRFRFTGDADCAAAGYPRVGFIVTNLSRPVERVVALYNGRSTAEQWIKEGKNATKWTRLSCCSFAANAVRLQLHALAYNLANFLRMLVVPDGVEKWSLTSLREKLVKIGAKLVVHGRYMTFQMAEVVVPRNLLRRILQMIDRLRSERPARCLATLRRRTCRPTGELRPMSHRTGQDTSFRRRNRGLGVSRDGPRTKYGVSRFPVVSGGSILLLRWLDRPAIWGMSEKGKI